jgi:hypothetical protein
VNAERIPSPRPVKLPTLVPNPRVKISPNIREILAWLTLSLGYTDIFCCALASLSLGVSAFFFCVRDRGEMNAEAQRLKGAGKQVVQSSATGCVGIPASPKTSVAYRVRKAKFGTK